MGSLSASDMDGYLQLLSCSDTKAKLTIANNLINYLADPDNSIECADIGLFIDSLVPWMQSSNNKVSQNGIDAMTYLVDRMGVDFRPYIPTVLPPIVDRLGDSKDMVREKAQLLILKLMEKDVISPQVLFEKLTPAFSHKNGKIREEVMNCLQATLTEHGAQAISISRLVPAIVKLLSDPMASVRDTAFNTLVEIYRHVGERLRMDLQKKHNVPTSKLPSLMARFDELKAAGDMLPTAVLQDGPTRADDEVDNAASASKRSNSVPRRAMVPPKSAPASTPGQAGAVDEETFCRAFEDVPTVQIFSAKELEEQLSRVKETISDPNKDWNKRVDALKKIRSLLIAGAANFDELYVHLRTLECPFQTTVKDLRSQVVREACYTIAYLSEQLCSKFDHFAEAILPNLINLIQNSAKVMASAGLVTVRFIIRYTHSPRLIPIICQNLNSKSKDIRRACCEFLEQLLSTWSTHSIERHIAVLQEAIKKGIADADLEARLSARKAYWNFRSHFPEQAESLLNSLDSSYKRALNGDLTMSNSSSSNSLHHQGRSLGSGGTTPRPRFTASATDGSPRRISTPSSTLRSNSAIDLQAAQRAKARAQYAAMSRQKAGSGASLPRPKKTDASSVMTASAITSPERIGRTRNRVAGVSQSQPSSRSGSPSSRLSYATYSARDAMASDGHHALSRPRRLSSGIPRSTGTSREASRETSPNRYTGIGLHDRSFGSKLRGRALHTMNSLERQPQSSRPVMAQKILQQSREAESALADALNFDTMDSGDFMRVGNNRKAYRAFDDHSDESETSSVCSERSFDSYRRPSDSFSWSGSQQRLYRDLLEPSCKNIAEIITNCASTHWTDRKEGLLALQNYFVSGNALTSLELRKITEIFTKMFNDSHTKVFSMFLDTLNELIFTHKADLSDWLYVLLTKLLNKLGGDLLGSIQTKIHKSLTIVRDSFPHEQLLNCVTKFLVDQTQTPNAKVKVATLTFLTQLATYMEPPSSLGSHPSTVPALAKIISWTSDAKSVEIRRASQAAVIALFNLNTPQVTMILSSLTPEYQEAASAVVQNHLRRNSSTGGDGNCNSPTLSPRLQSPSTPQQPRVPRNTAFDLDDSLNPEEVYKSLRRTTAEIQNYSFEGGLGSGKLIDRDRDTTSQDSGISQMSVGIGDKLVDGLEEGLEALSINSTPSYNNTSPTHRLHETDNGFISVENHLEEDTEAVHKVLESLRMPETEGFERTEAERKMALEQLIKLVREGNTVTIIEQFKHLLRYLLEQLAKPEASVRILVLHALTEMLKKPSLSSCFQNYVELLVLKVLEAHKDSSKQVSREAESCAATMGSVLPPDSVIRVLNPLITTGDYPVNQAAIKMLTKLVENKTPDVIEPHLGEVMPGLIKAYDNEESAVRKSAVFCMVALHTVVGESAMQPHLSSLSGSKLKLLHLYIKRAQQGSSVPTSPKNAAL